jgi:acetylornithine deacetylase
MSENNAIEILKSLVSFDTTSYRSNLELITFIESYLKSHNIKSTLVYDSSCKKANLYAKIGSNKNDGIMLSGHTDVVPTTNQDWADDPFHLIQKDDKLYGRGTADMKSFLALILSRVPKFISANLSKTIHLAFSYDEEVGCIGVHRLIDLINNNHIKPAFCIVGEPTSMEVVIGHKGKCSYQVDVSGLACHSGQSPLGVNAINYASKLIEYIAEINKEKSIKGPFDYDYEIPYTTLQTGVISGGITVNIVPDFCKFEFEIRHLSKDNPKELINRIKNYAKENILPDMHKVSFKTGVHFREKVSYPGLSINRHSELVKYIKKLLNTEKHKKVIFGTEGGLFQEKLKIPTVVCGPGSIDQAHKANEYISLDQIEKGGKFLDVLIASLRKS